MKAYIVVLNYNNWKDTICCLDSLLCLGYTDFQIVVVDNASTDASRAMIEQWSQGTVQSEMPQEFSNKLGIIPPDKSISYLTADALQKVDSKIVYIQSKENNGYAAGNNLGIAYATLCEDYNFVWVINNDIFVEKDSLGKLVEKSIKNRKVLLGNTVYYFYRPNIMQTTGIGLHNSLLAFSFLKTRDRSFAQKVLFGLLTSFFSFKFVYGASVFLTKETLAMLDFKLNEQYFLYFEEQDTACRIIKAGGQIDTCPEAVVYHKSGNTINSNNSPKKSTMVDYYFNRNKILFTKTYFPALTPFVKASVYLTALRRKWAGQAENHQTIIEVLRAN